MARASGGSLPVGLYGLLGSAGRCQASRTGRARYFGLVVVVVVFHRSLP